jgi:hypothetical protein
LLKGRVGVIEAARAIRALAFSMKVENEPEFLLFIVIDSETDDMPVGEVRARWAPDALRREDVRIEAAEVVLGDRAVSAASKLAERYDSGLNSIACPFADWLSMHSPLDGCARNQPSKDFSLKYVEDARTTVPRWTQAFVCGLVVRSINTVTK